MALSETAEKDPVEVPPVLLMTTTAPPVVILFPAVSLARKVRRVPLPEETVLKVEDNVLCARLKTPGTTVIVGSVDVTAEPLIVALIVVADPATTPVNKAEKVPFPLSVLPVMFPVEVPPENPKTTVCPPEIILLL